MSDQEEPSKVARKQSMLYEACPLCKGTGNGLLAPGGCLCKKLGVIETGVTVSQLERLAKLDLLRQENGIPASMLQQGRVRKMIAAVKAIITKADGCTITNDYLDPEITALKEALGLVPTQESVKP